MTSITEIYGDRDADIINEQYITYQSANADSRRAWACYIYIGGRDYLPVSFYGETEAEAHDRAKSFWDKDRAAREEKIKNRREATAKIKAAEKAKGGAA